jgi:predicted RNase H-like HicB family nuclease
MGRIRSRFAWPWRCAAGKTLDEVKELIREAVEFHLEGMRAHGDPIPVPSARTEHITV